MRLVGLLAVVAALAGCASVQPIIAPTSVLNDPPLNTVAQRNLGETIIRRGVVAHIRTLTIGARLTAAGGLSNGLLNTVAVNPGTYAFSARNASLDFYNGGHVEQTGAVNMLWRNGGVCVQTGTAMVVGISSMPGVCADLPAGSQVNGVIGTAERNAGSELRELLYNGRSGSTIRFLYREYAATSGGSAVARPAFSQELTYDLNESPIIGFQSVRVEVLEASNTTIRYRVLQSF